jgi:hypothetical protein
MTSKKPVRLWSPHRPERPDSDPIHLEIMALLDSDPRSIWDKADASGLSTTTLYNWRKRKTKRPTGIALHMAARMLGRRIRLD